MRTNKHSRFHDAVIENLFPIIFFLVIVTLILFATSSVEQNTKQQSRKITEDAIRRAIISCYALEGSYPPSIEYLEKNYGLYISDRYTVFYTAMGANLPPDLTVLEN